MVEPGLPALYQLHLVDAALHEMKARVASLDTGKQEIQQIRELEAERKDLAEAMEVLQKQIDQRDVKRQQLESKAEKMKNDLYSGKVGARDAEATQKEIDSNIEQAIIYEQEREELAAQMVEPKAQLKAIEELIQSLKTHAVKKRKVAEEEHNRIKAEFAKKAEERVHRANAVPKRLLTAYDNVRKQTHGTGMAVILENGNCGACGISVSEKTKESTAEDNLCLCPQCHRIYFVLVPSR